jgi:hypothetical protein
MKRWIVHKWPNKPEKGLSEIEFTCVHCMKDGLLQIAGRVEAQLGQGLVYDPACKFSMPDEIQCAYCRRRYEHE